MTQREGRILRQGNTNAKVQIFRYITEGSFDAYSWQLLETKQRFISALLSGSLTQRSSSDIDNTVLDYAEVKALAIGNPLVKERVETANKLSRYRILQRKFLESRLFMENELAKIPEQIANQQKAVHACQSDVSFYSDWKAKNPPILDPAAKKTDQKNRKLLRESIHRAVMENILQPQEKALAQYRGFELCLPAHAIREKPYIWLKREGRYYLELGDAETGILRRIDHYLEGLPQHLEKLRNNLVRLEHRERDLQKQLSKGGDFAGAIEQCRRKLRAIDKKLGVIQNE